MEIKKIDKGQMFLSPKNFKVKVRFGRIWMTIEGDSEDYILNSGEWVWVQEGRRVLLEGIEDAQIFLDAI